MGIEIFLAEQLKKHPFMQPQDMVKMCYQAAYGAEHLLSDMDMAKAYLEKEYDRILPSKGELYEQISDGVIRVNLSAWKQKELPLEWLFTMFTASCEKRQNAKEQFANYLQTAERMVASLKTGFTMQEWESYIKKYHNEGKGAVHHSEQYRKNEHPAYRIVDQRFCRIFPILEEIKKEGNGDKPYIIVIDGRAASGKTTLAKSLQMVLDADVIHMDDFFVPLELRLKERFLTPGENIHYERFKEEVLPFVSKSEPFSYRIFDCSKMEYFGQRKIGGKPFCIVEGSYSCHPKFGTYGDFTVFSTISQEEQIERIRKRNGEDMLKMFVKRWIPLEEEYFSYYKIRDKVDLVL